MRKLLIIGIGCSLLMGCATQKRTIKTESQTEQQSDSTSTKQATSEKQTTTYGEELKGEGFIAADDTAASYSMESKGIKVKVKLKPAYDKNGKLKGHQLEYESTAKPTSVTNEKQSSTTTTQAQNSTQHQEQVSDVKKEKQRSVMTLLLVGAGLMLLLILLIVWLYFKIKI